MLASVLYAAARKGLPAITRKSVMRTLSAALGLLFIGALTLPATAAEMIRYASWAPIATTNNPGEQPNHIEPCSAALAIAGGLMVLLRLRSPYRISESGQVVGRGEERGFGPALVWENGVFRNVGVGEAQDINDAGQILLSVPLVGDGRPTPRIWQSGVAPTLPIPPWHSDFRHFYDMNASGHVVGQAVDRAFLWANGQLTYLDSTFGGQASSAYAINDAGQVIGRASTGFLWDQGNVTLLPDTAMDINNRGQVLLLSSVWENGQATPLPLLPLLPGSIPESTDLRAEAINERGQVVVRQTEMYLIDPESGHGARYRNYLWDPILGAQDLTSLVGDDPQEWGFALVTDVNSAGQIVGIRETEAFLLTPVPAPASVWLVVCAGCVLGAIASRASFRRFSARCSRGRVSPRLASASWRDAAT